MPIINTSRGPMDSHEASQLFARDDQHDTNFLLGIYHQLLEKSVTDAAYATKYILEHPERFNQKIVVHAKSHQFDNPIIAARPAHVTTWPHLSQEVNQLLASNPDLFYDENLFCKLCCELGHAEQAKQWTGKIVDPNSSMDKVLTVIPFMLRQVFLERYVQAFAQELQI